MKFDNTFIHLPKNFYTASIPFAFKRPVLIALNLELANDLAFNFKEYKNDELALIFSGQKKLMGSEFISMVYAAHQFGHFVPILGDGRAILIGEVIAKNNSRFDIQLKGAGPTNYSRRGDGFSALGPVLREFMLSEFMHTMKIPTTRALAAVATNENVYREDVLPGGVFTRVAKSHIRIGTFQYFYANNDLENLKKLLEYSIERHYPEILKESTIENNPLLFFKKVRDAQIELVANWMSIGFIHGVMNTDNMSISGETIDYGPCAFMDYFNYEQVYSFIDKNKRYSYINQPNILVWNLARLAETLTPFVLPELLEAELAVIKEKFEIAFTSKLSKKLALDETSLNDEEKKNLISNFLEILDNKNLDFTSSFRALATGLISNNLEGELADFFLKWRELFKGDLTLIANIMNSINPIYIPRNHLVEKMIEQGLTGDYSQFILMNEVLKNPFEENSKYNDFSLPPTLEEIVPNTFCGT